MDNSNTITLHEYIKSKGQIECLCPILCFLVTFYSGNEVKCDQNVEYGTIKSLIVRISPPLLIRQIRIKLFIFGNLHRFNGFETTMKQQPCNLNLYSVH